jgi:hypothetical protein
MKWECPTGCGYQCDWDGTCPDCILPLILAPPARDEPLLPPHRYAICFPWSQLVEIPAGGIQIGRGLPPLYSNDNAREFEQVSGRHARIFWGAENTLYIEDLSSTNGTYVDGHKLAPGCPTPIIPGQPLQLAEDVEIQLLELNEYGEPM